MSRQLQELAKPFPASLTKQKPGSFAADYVSHASVTEKLLAVVGPFSWEVVEVIRNADGMVSGCLGRLTVEVDGKTVTITEVGDVERPSANAATTLKAASSDAIKRAAMRVGCGLSLWSQADYALDRALAHREASAVAAEGPDMGAGV